jgi:hypothetical protein
MATGIQLKEETYTVIGKYGCGFTEVCHTLIDKCEKATEQTLSKQFFMFFEDAYEYHLELLKKKLPKEVLSHFDVARNLKRLRPLHASSLETNSSEITITFSIILRTDSTLNLTRTLPIQRMLLRRGGSII